ncbi:MAG: SH3 domain-containing protein, partial [Nitrospirota bacterium]
MKTNSIINLAVTFFSLIILTIMFTADDSFARSRDRQYSGPRHSHNERVIVKKHDRHRSEWKAKRKFFNKSWRYERPYKRWKYDRPYRRGYYYPRERYVRRLPFGYRTVWYGGDPFFVFNSVYYRNTPSGYVVVQSPPETVVVREAPKPVKPFESASGNVLVTISTLNVRTGPGLDYSLVSQVEEGSILEVRGKTDGWLYVHL